MTPGEGLESIPGHMVPMKLPGTSEKEIQNTKQTCLGVYWEGLCRPCEVGMQRGGGAEDGMSRFSGLSST